MQISSYARYIYILYTPPQERRREGGSFLAFFFSYSALSMWSAPKSLTSLNTCLRRNICITT